MMIFLIFILSIFSADTCTDSICNLEVKSGGVTTHAMKMKDRAEIDFKVSNAPSSWGRPQEVKDVCPSGHVHTDIDGSPVPIDDRTEISKEVVNLEYPIFDEDGNQTGTGNHDCDRYTFPADYTIEITNAQAEKDAQDYTAAGSQAKSLCDKIYHMVMGYNISRNFDTPTLNQMKVDFKDAKEYIQDCQVLEAKAAIQAITPHADKFTQEFKDLILNEFTKAGF